MPELAGISDRQLSAYYAGNPKYRSKFEDGRLLTDVFLERYHESLFYYKSFYDDLEQVGGQEYEEIHVDGGVSTQVMVYPAQIDLRKATESLGLPVSDQVIYVIRNGYLNARWQQVDLTLAPILLSSLDTLIRTQGLGDLYRIYLGALRDQAKYRLAYVPPEFKHERKEMFDPEYMRALFNFAYERAKNGYPWEKSPPGFTGSYAN